MLLLNRRKIVQLIMSFMLLLSLTFPLGFQPADAAQAGIGSRVVKIAAGMDHSLALKSDGTVVAWGTGFYGQITVPAGLTGVVSIAGGGFRSLALKSDGTVVAWGDNRRAQSDVPAGLTSPIKGNKIAGGANHSLALKSDGTVVAWGSNDKGQIRVPAGLTGVVSIAGGIKYSLALKSDGTVVAWGDDGDAQKAVPAGLTGVVSIAGGWGWGWGHSLALKSDGTVVAWGANENGQSTVPDGLTGVVSIAGGANHSVALKSDGIVVAWGSNIYGQSRVPDGLTGVVSIAAGDSHSLALKSDGTVVAWGDDGDAQKAVPDGLTGVVSIAGGINYSLALKSDGTVVAWGWGDDGDAQKAVPAGLTGVVSIAVGMSHSLALKSDGTVVAWGDNSEGQTDVPGNDNLKDLSLQEGSFDTSFSPAVTSYTSYIGPSVSSVNITATLEDTTKAALYVNNQPQVSGSAATVDVSGALTIIPVRVEPYLKVAKTYTVTVLKDSTPPVIQFDTNGNPSPGKSAASKVTVTDTESGVDTFSLQYAWTQSATNPTNDEWKDFSNGDTLEQTSGDGNWYLHIQASDQVGNSVNTGSNVFVLDNTPPTVEVSSKAGGTVNAAFPITITFSEPVSGFGDGGIEVGNGTVSNFATGSVATSYTAMITPTVSGQDVTVNVAANSATDAVGNGNEASNVKSFLYDTTKPVVSFGGFTDGQRFPAPPASVQVTVSEAVYWVADGTELNDFNALQLLSMDKDDTAFSAYTASYDEATRIYTLTFDGTLGDGAYKVKVAGNVVENSYHNTLDAANASFIVAVPVVTGISADPTHFTSTGGNVEVTIAGSNLSGQTMSVYADGVAIATANVISDTSASAAVILLPNTTASDKTYVLTVYLNGVEVVGQSETLTVAHALSSNADLSGLSLSIGALSPSPFAATTTGYTASVTNSVSSLTVTPTAADPTATVTVNGMAVTSASASNGIGLNEGGNTITVLVTAQDGMTTKTYTIEVMRASAPTPTPTPTPIPTPTPTPIPTPAPKSFYIDGVNIDVIKAMVAKSNAAPAVSFKDVPADAPNAKAIVLATKLGIINGYEDNSFHANATITRAEFASMLVRALGLTSEGGSDFVDTKGHWAADTIATLKTIGIANGYLDGAFKPNQTITRAEIVAMLSKVMNTNFVENAKFEDVIGHWAEAEIDRLSDMGIVKGKSDGLFKPDANATRYESLLMILRMLNVSLDHSLDIE